MKQFHTAVVERKKTFTADFQTHPYETAWASEALFFLRVDAMEGDTAELHGGVQISPDGVNWVDEGTDFEPITDEGDYFVRVSHFGGWLRLACAVDGDDAEVKVTIHLVLKE